MDTTVSFERRTSDFLLFEENLSENLDLIDNFLFIFKHLNRAWN
jgi:hypothetical protein